jgi:hypothetical protein
MSVSMFIIGTGGFMSRSYKRCRIRSTKYYRYWKRKMRRALRHDGKDGLIQELKAVENKDAVYPMRSPSGHGYWDAASPAVAVRRQFNSETLCILNNGLVREVQNGNQTQFLSDCQRIKEGNSYSCSTKLLDEAHFRWLDLAATRKVIREWQGEYLDVIPYLVRRGLIERAVKKWTRIFNTK